MSDRKFLLEILWRLAELVEVSNTNKVWFALVAVVEPPTGEAIADRSNVVDIVTDVEPLNPTASVEVEWPVIWKYLIVSKVVAVVTDPKILTYVVALPMFFTNIL